jgi:hypothetical protein
MSSVECGLLADVSQFEIDYIGVMVHCGVLKLGTYGVEAFVEARLMHMQTDAKKKLVSSM